MLTTIFVIIYIIVFFCAVIYSVLFQFRKESRDERGQKILAISQAFVFPFLIPAWLFIKYIVQPETSNQYDNAIWFMITGFYILHSVVLFAAKRRI